MDVSIYLDFKDDLLHKLGSWVRLRDEGDKITLTHKIHSKSKKDQLKIEEFEITVNNFDDAVIFLESLNMKVKTYQENYRENWILKLQFTAGFKTAAAFTFCAVNGFIRFLQNIFRRGEFRQDKADPEAHPGND